MPDQLDPRMVAWALRNHRIAQRDSDQAPQIGDTQLTPEQEIEFLQQWKPQHAPRDSGYDYDNRAAYLADKQGLLPPTDARGHGTDAFKKPWHPTYSSESKIPPLDGMSPGRWSQTPDGQMVFDAGTQNLQFHTPEQLQEYFRTAEPNVRLNLPQKKRP